MKGPAAVAIDADGNLYVADKLNHRVRRIDPSGPVTTVAGSGRSHFDGDGGPATEASLWAPDGVAVDSKGHLYIADADNGRIRRIDRSETRAVALDSSGNVYIADTRNYRIRRSTSPERSRQWPARAGAGTSERPWTSPPFIAVCSEGLKASRWTRQATSTFWWGGGIGAAD